jgi:hypothetical protein
MKKSAYGRPILIDNGTTRVVQRIEDVSEIMIQDLVFEHPECVPISDIDEAFNPVIPVCKELRTPVGPLDVFMITANGDLIIIETKLWRNPEARRKVVAQILDYATELSKWNYEDLQREINRNLNLKGNSLYEIAKKRGDYFTLNESDFVDTVSRNLSRGKFLLLIVGDGIKEGAASIADFLYSAAHMNFTFGLVELNLYELGNGKKIVLPKTIAKTTEIQKINFDFPAGVKIVLPDSQETNDSKKQIKNNDLDKRREFFTVFWKEFLDQLDLDDPGQPLPKPTIHQNIYLYPHKSKNAWISAYFMQSNKRVGVYFRFSNDQNGIEMAEYLSQFKNEIKEELNSNDIWWSDESNSFEGFGVRLPIEDVYSIENREIIKDFFRHWMNNFVNIIRPRLKNYSN